MCVAGTVFMCASEHLICLMCWNEYTRPGNMYTPDRFALNYRRTNRPVEECDGYTLVFYFILADSRFVRVCVCVYLCVTPLCSRDGYTARVQWLERERTCVPFICKCTICSVRVIQSIFFLTSCTIQISRHRLIRTKCVDVTLPTHAETSVYACACLHSQRIDTSGKTLMMKYTTQISNRVKQKPTKLVKWVGSAIFFILFSQNVQSMKHNNEAIFVHSPPPPLHTISRRPKIKHLDLQVVQLLIVASQRISSDYISSCKNAFVCFWFAPTRFTGGSGEKDQFIFACEKKI